VIRSQPTVDYFSDLDLGPREPEPSRRLLATITSVALHIDDQVRGRLS
jgi:hypothetical protein